MGTTIHGIIGYDLLKDVIAKINYNKKGLLFTTQKLIKIKNVENVKLFH